MQRIRQRGRGRRTKKNTKKNSKKNRMKNIALRNKLKILKEEIKKRKQEGGNWYILENISNSFIVIIESLEKKEKNNETELRKGKLNHLNLILKIINAIEYKYSGIENKGSKLNRTEKNKYHH